MSNLLSAGAAPSPNPSSEHWTTRPWLGVFGVLLGAMIAAFTGRLISVGLADLRAGMGLGVDEATWIGTTFNAALMFVGPFSVYLGAVLGARRVLLYCAGAFTLISVMLPVCGHGAFFFVLLACSGLTAGTFYPLTLSFIVRNLPPKFVLLGIAMYAMDIVFTTYIAAALEAWYLEHLSWHWLFWNSVLLTPIMFVLVLFGIPGQPIPKPKDSQPKPSWRGFLYSSLGFSLLYIALDQGQRLDWLGSGLIISLLVTAGFLFLCMAVRHVVFPNPLIHIGFLGQWNIVILGILLAFFRLVMLSAVVVVPNFLATVQNYNALQTGTTLLWIALPQVTFSLLAMWLLRQVDPRMILGAGFFAVGLGCVINSRLTSVWAGQTFWPSLLILAFGFAFAFNGLVASIILQAFNTGLTKRPVEALTYGGYFQTIRLFGGQIGTAFVLHLIVLREQIHSNVLVDYANAGSSLALQRFYLLRSVISMHTDTVTASSQAAALLGLQIRQQSFTIAIADTFHLLGWAALIALLFIALLRREPVQYSDVLRPVKAS